MTVILDANGRPVVFGDEVQGGRQIPDPPDPPHEHRYTDADGWVHDPPASLDVSAMTDAEIAAALRDGSILAPEVLAQMIEDGRV